MSETDPRLAAFARLLAIVDRLRAPDGCPWDRAQTLPSMAPHVLEEAHELVESLRSADDEPRAEAEARKEAGDLLVNVLLLARIGQDSGRFSLTEIAQAAADKLVRRHPHVFGEEGADGAEAAFSRWEEAKRRERAHETEAEHRSILAGVPKELPALLRAQRTGEKCASVGFEWPDLAGPFAKLREELDELEREATAATPDSARVRSELGDVLFSAVNVARHLGVDAEMALRACVDRFSRRFRHVEERLGERLGSASLSEMDRLWDEAKAGEASDF